MVDFSSPVVLRSSAAAALAGCRVAGEALTWAGRRAPPEPSRLRRKPRVQAYHGYLDPHVQVGPAAVLCPPGRLKETDARRIPGQRPRVRGAEPVLRKRVRHGVQQPLVVT